MAKRDHDHVPVTESLEVEVLPEKAPKKVHPLYQLDNGSEGSRSAYIRQEFLKDRSRVEISKELEVEYYIVYSATVNMYNAKHPEGGGTTRVGSARGVLVEYEDPETGITSVLPRAEVMRKLYRTGTTKAELAAMFGAPYATVYAATKREDPSASSKTARTKHTVVHPVTGEEVSRTVYIRELFAEGKSRREIADLLSCDYAIVWAATSPKKDKDGTGSDNPDPIIPDQEIEEDLE